MLRRNVLIFHQAALGDFVLTWPLAVTLGRLYPQSRIMYVTSGGKGKLAERALGVDALDAETGWPALFAKEPTVIEPVAKALVQAHAIFDFVAGPGTDWMATVAKLAPTADVHHLPTRPPVGYEKHASDFLMESLAATPAVRTAVEQILRSISDRGVATRRTVGQTVAIHPGSGSLSKNWPLANYVELANRLTAGGRPVRFVIGEVERERWSPTELAQLAAIAQLRTPTDYVALHSDLVDAAVYVGNDSGPSHLAGICGVPTVAIFASTDPRVWRPLGPKVVTMENPTVDDAIDRVTGLLA